MISLEVKPESLQLKQLKVNQTDLILEFLDERVLRVPLNWYPRLLYASDQEREVFELLDEGRLIHWPLVDEDLSIVGLLSGLRSAESQESLQRWLDSRA
jgi:hypothetical protein